MATLEARMREASAKNTELLQILAETNNAIPNLRQQRQTVTNLEAQLAESGERVKQVNSKLAKDLRSYQSYRDSTLRRFAYNMARKQEAFESKAREQETQYNQTLEQEHHERRTNDSLAAQLSTFRHGRTEMEQLAARNIAAQLELDITYHAVFSGSAPGFPGAVQRQDASNALEAYNQAERRADNQDRVVQHLKDGKVQIESGIQYMWALIWSLRLGMLFNDKLMDAREQELLSKAERCLQDTRMSVWEAKQLSPTIGDLPPVHPGHTRSLREDDFCTAYLSRLDLYNEIERGLEQMQKAARVLENMSVSEKVRLEGLKAQLRRREETLDPARAALQRAREEAFRAVVG